MTWVVKNFQAAYVTCILLAVISGKPNQPGSEMPVQIPDHWLIEESWARPSIAQKCATLGRSDLDNMQTNSRDTLRIDHMLKDSHDYFYREKELTLMFNTVFSRFDAISKRLEESESYSCGLITKLKAAEDRSRRIENNAHVLTYKLQESENAFQKYKESIGDCIELTRNQRINVTMLLKRYHVKDEGSVVHTNPRKPKDNTGDDEEEKKDPSNGVQPTGLRNYTHTDTHLRYSKSTYHNATMAYITSNNATKEQTTKAELILPEDYRNASTDNNVRSFSPQLYPSVSKDVKVDSLHKSQHNSFYPRDGREVLATIGLTIDITRGGASQRNNDPELRDQSEPSDGIGLKHTHQDIHDTDREAKGYGYGYWEVEGARLNYYLDKGEEEHNAEELGPKGPNGSQGPLGPPTEANDETWTYGDDSFRQAVDVPGPPGPTGPTGPPGTPGTPGTPGSSGTPGATGAAGPAGAAGAAGVAGPAGGIGPVGPTGATGIPGFPGVAGATGGIGPSGATGASGAAGAAGATGPIGPSGSNGYPGPSGPPGPVGPPGIVRWCGFKHLCNYADYRIVLY